MCLIEIDGEFFLKEFYLIIYDLLLRDLCILLNKVMVKFFVWDIDFMVVLFVVYDVVYLFIEK